MKYFKHRNVPKIKDHTAHTHITFLSTQLEGEGDIKSQKRKVTWRGI